MTAPSLISAARNAPDCRDRILRMAAIMRHHAFGPEGGCTAVHLYCAGFTEAEGRVYRDPARAVLSKRPSELRTDRPGVRDGDKLAALAWQIKVSKRTWHTPVVGPAVFKASA